MPQDPLQRATRLFILDLCGATLSALLSGLVLPGYVDALGLDPAALRTLAAVAVCLALFDAACLLVRPRRWRAALRAVALGNLAYPIVAGAVVSADDRAITGIGAALIGVESLVVVWLGWMQLRATRGDGD